jgi:hypothetical protein
MRIRYRQSAALFDESASEGLVGTGSGTRRWVLGWLRMRQLVHRRHHWRRRGDCKAGCTAAADAGSRRYESPFQALR